MTDNKTKEKKGKNTKVLRDFTREVEGEESKAQPVKPAPSKASEDDWEENVPEFALGQSRGMPTQVPKPQKKKVFKPVTWEEQQQASKPETQPEPAPVQPQEPAAKKKIMNLPGKGVSQKRSEAGALIAQEYFPSLGEEAPTPKPVERVAKPIEKSAEKSTDKVSFGTQPPKFMTSKKIERSEQPPLQSTQTSSPPLQTQTQTHTITTTTTTTSEAPKFKFGSDRPTFSSSKTGEKKQIVKTEEELKREEREREIEERLAKDKEEELKRRDERLAKKAKREEETGVKTDTVPTTTTAPTVTVTEGEKKDSEKKERLGFSNFKRKEINAEVNKEEIKQEIKPDSTNGQETQTKLVKKNPKPKNNDENGEHKEKRTKKPRDEKPEPPKEDEVKEEVKPAQAHDVIAVTATSTTASWDIGLKKIPKKKT